VNKMEFRIPASRHHKIRAITIVMVTSKS